MESSKPGSLRGGCSLLSTLTPHPTQSIVVYSLCLHRHTLSVTGILPGVCLPWSGVRIWGPQLTPQPCSADAQISRQKQNGVLESRMPHSGEGGGKGF